MNSELYFKNPKGEQYKVVFTSENDKDINCLLDQLDKMNYKQDKIKPEEFLVKNPVTIDIYDETNKYKIGEMTLEDFGIDEVEDGFVFS